MSDSAQRVGSGEPDSIELAGTSRADERVRECLSELSITFQWFEHPPVNTCEEAAAHLQHVPGLGTKNLFLRDKPGRRHWVVTVPEWKQVDLKALSDVIGCGRFSFGSDERLKEHLDLLPGSVTLMGVLNNPSKSVEMIFDQALLAEQLIHCHPLRNTATVVLTPDDALKILRYRGHAVSVIEVPARA